MRKEETMKLFPRRQPTKKMVLTFFTKMTCMKNVPEVQDVIHSWKPMTESHHQCLINTFSRVCIANGGVESLSLMRKEQ
ncbi:hypothetical protein NDU88_004066 [Pleurodeles waltl]|uniref:Uncharacterized protein n=1 Tax=Pleurodeles waltl TaxID=8319 RepID=A0AAV7W3X4_PLEWA|nr:hypothetical protein NDU88_004066 [Pleurodeles waltl]